MTRGKSLAAVSLLALSAGSAHAQNVAQVDGQIGVLCDNTHGLVVAVPGLAVQHLRTTGNPVLVHYTVQFNGNVNAGLTIWTAIDGELQVGGQRDKQLGPVFQVNDVTFSRVYMIPKGDHTFSLYAACQGQVMFSTNWLTVYELPNGRGN